MGGYILDDLWCFCLSFIDNNEPVDAVRAQFMWCLTDLTNILCVLRFVSLAFCCCEPTRRAILLTWLPFVTQWRSPFSHLSHFSPAFILISCLHKMWQLTPEGQKLSLHGRLWSRETDLNGLRFFVVWLCFGRGTEAFWIYRPHSVELSYGHFNNNDCCVVHAGSLSCLTDRDEIIYRLVLLVTPVLLLQSVPFVSQWVS